MARVAFATCSAHPLGIDDDQRAAHLLGAEFHVWDDAGIDWSAFDRVVVRSVWDYTTRPEQFLAWVDSVGGARLRNAPELIRFNADKRYLVELDAPVVATTLLEPGDSMPDYATEIVVKPNISAGARDTGRFMPDAHAEAAALVQEIHESGRAALLQPYLTGVDSDGERAVVFFGGEISHVLHKRPVLREHGIAPRTSDAHSPAAIMLEPDLVVPGHAGPEQLELARRVHAEIAERFGQPLFARVDMVPGPDGMPVLIELEAIEPMLYLDLVPGAAERLAAAVGQGLV
jgi:hypothetical protein